MKYVLFVAFAILVIYLVRGRGRSLPDSPAQPDASAPGQPAIEAIMACAVCGVHAPVSEMVTDASGITFCSEDHRARHATSRV